MAGKKSSTENASGRRAAKKTAARKSVTRKSAAKKKSAATRATPKQKATKKASAAGKPSAKKTVVPKRAAGAKLGRARITGDAKLDEFFKRDYEARQVCEFLRVHTVRELEEFSPQQIIERLTGPMVRTIDRIRKALALNNRALKDDQRYAIEFLSAIGGTPRTRKVRPGGQ